MGGRTVAAFLNLRNPTTKPSVKMNGAEVLEGLKSQGYDGTILSEEGVETEYAVFSPTQIKSATDNVGTFDGGNPDIRYHMPRGGAFRFSETYGGKMIVMAALDEIFRKSPKSVTGEREQEDTGLSADEQKYVALISPFVASYYGAYGFSSF